MVVMFLRENLLFLLAVCLSILLSTWINIRETVINPDAICYLLSAETYTQSGLTAAMNLCGQAKWPFYSVIVSGLTQLTHFSYTLSAYLLNGFFSLLSVWMFLKIVKELGGTERILWIAAFIILLSHEFNSVRQYIIRDHGFWAFYLVSLFALLRFTQHPKWLSGSVFSLSLLIATLFRIEGLIFLFTLPFILLFCNQYSLKQRLQYFCILNVPSFFISIVIGAWLILHPQDTIEKLSRIAEVFNQLQHGIFIIAAQYQHTKTALLQYVLTADSARDAGLLLFLVMIIWYLINVLGNLSWIYSLLVIYAWRSKAAQFSRNALLVLGGYLLVNLIVTFSFFAQHYFLSKRYLIALSLILMLWVPFALDKLFQQRFNLKPKILLILAGSFIFISSLGGIINFGHSKSYIRTAGDWIAVNVPTTASLYVNDYQLMYYTKHFNASLFQHLHDLDIHSIAQEKWKQYDYLAIHLSKNDDAKTLSIIKTIPLTPTKIFANKRGDQVIVYQVRRTS